MPTAQPSMGSAPTPRAQVRSQLSTGFSFPLKHIWYQLATVSSLFHLSPGCTDGTTLLVLSLAVGSQASHLTSLSLHSLLRVK